MTELETPKKVPTYVVTVVAMMGDETPPLFRTYGPFSMQRANAIRKEINDRIARQDWQRYKRLPQPTLHVGVSPVANYMWRSDVPWETLA